MKKVWECRSTNGRWGAQIACATESSQEFSWPARGTLRGLGKAAGIECFEFAADSTAATWILPGGDVEAVEGATRAYHESLQSGSAGSILVLGPVALVRWQSYRGRSARYRLYVEGAEQDAPPSVLIALGLVQPDKAPAPIAAPEPVSGAFADALRAAGVRR